MKLLDRIDFHRIGVSFIAVGAVLLVLIVMGGCSADSNPNEETSVPTVPTVPSSTTPAVKPSPSLQRGVAVLGARCNPEGAHRLTEDGQLAVCAYGPNGSTGTQRLEWKLA